VKSESWRPTLAELAVAMDSEMRERHDAEQQGLIRPYVESRNLPITGRVD
jgi:hypothetical protein